MGYITNTSVTLNDITFDVTGWYEASEKGDFDTPPYPSTLEIQKITHNNMDVTSIVGISDLHEKIEKLAIENIEDED